MGYGTNLAHRVAHITCLNNVHNQIDAIVKWDKGERRLEKGPFDAGQAR